MSYEDVQKAFIAFWDMRKIVKEQQRQELEERTAPERAILKAAIEKHRSDSGDSIQAIAEFLDTKNRNFLYQIIKDQPLVESDPEKRRTARATKLTDHEAEVAPIRDSGMSYSIGMGTVPNSFVVTVEPGSLSYNIVRDENGDFDIPEDWFESSDPVVIEFFRDLVRAVENA